MCSRRWQRQRTSCEKLGARNAKVSSGASRAAQSKKRRNEVRRRNGRRKAARTLADRNLVLTEAVQGNLDGFVAFRRTFVTCRPRCHPELVEGSTIVPVEHAALWNERFAANPRGYQHFLVDARVRGIAPKCGGRLSFGHVDEQSTASSEKLAGEYRNYGRRKPDGCDAAETNTTPSWLIPSARGSAPRSSRRMKPRRPPAPRLRRVRASSRPRL
jgi:hypothetical protein